jgi:hypothetical protein
MSCEFCGNDRPVRIAEVVAVDRSFVLEYCCEQGELGWSDFDWSDVARYPEIYFAEFRSLFGDVGQYIRTVYIDDYGRLSLDFGLELGEIDLDTAREFVGRHHRHNPAPVTWRFGFGCFNGLDLVGVCVVGNPAARLIDRRLGYDKPTVTLEVNRLCVRTDLPHAVVKDACSKMYAHAARETLRRFDGRQIPDSAGRSLRVERIITYTLGSENGASLRAAGWEETGITRDADVWDRPSRRRSVTSPREAKVRWEKQLRKHITTGREHPDEQMALFGRPIRRHCIANSGARRDFEAGSSAARGSQSHFRPVMEPSTDEAACTLLKRR